MEPKVGALAGACEIGYNGGVNIPLPKEVTEALARSKEDVERIDSKLEKLVSLFEKLVGLAEEQNKISAEIRDRA